MKGGRRTVRYAYRLLPPSRLAGTPQQKIAFPPGSRTKLRAGLERTIAYFDRLLGTSDNAGARPRRRVRLVPDSASSTKRAGTARGTAHVGRAILPDASPARQRPMPTLRDNAGLPNDRPSIRETPRGRRSDERVLYLSVSTWYEELGPLSDRLP
jgi:hypothetical protein